MNKNIIFSAIFLIVGLGLGFLFFGDSVSIKDRSLNNTDVVMQDDSSKDESEYNKEDNIITQNKLFDFMNSFKDYSNLTSSLILLPGSIVDITQVEPNLELMIIKHATSGESDSYSVYDYHSNVLYKGIGYQYLGDGNQLIPINFIDKNRVLMFGGNGGFTMYPLYVKNFRDNSVKNLDIKMELDVNKIHTTTDFINGIIHIHTMDRDNTYKLDPKTLQVTIVK